MQEHTLAWVVGEWSSPTGITITIQAFAATTFAGLYETLYDREEHRGPSHILGRYQRCEDGGILLWFSVTSNVTLKKKDGTAIASWVGRLFGGDSCFIASWTLLNDLTTRTARGMNTFTRDTTRLFTLHDLS